MPPPNQSLPREIKELSTRADYEMQRRTSSASAIGWFSPMHRLNFVSARTAIPVGVQELGGCLPLVLREFGGWKGLCATGRKVANLDWDFEKHKEFHPDVTLSDSLSITSATAAAMPH
jgi:hypothetical protein